jgi:hypothetical protein
MEVVYPCCCGIDVHERFVVACLTRVHQGQRHKELRRFDTFTSGLRALREWLVQAHYACGPRKYRCVLASSV